MLIDGRIDGGRSGEKRLAFHPGDWAKFGFELVLIGWPVAEHRAGRKLNQPLTVWVAFHIKGFDSAASVGISG